MHGTSRASLGGGDQSRRKNEELERRAAITFDVTLATPVATAKLLVPSEIKKQWPLELFSSHKPSATSYSNY